MGHDVAHVGIVLRDEIQHLPRLTLTEQHGVTVSLIGSVMEAQAQHATKMFRFHQHDLGPIWAADADDNVRLLDREIRYKPPVGDVECDARTGASMQLAPSLHTSGMADTICVRYLTGFCRQAGGFRLGVPNLIAMVMGQGCELLPP